MDELQPLRVYMAAGGLVPQAFRWHGSTLRVLNVEMLGLRGNERRYRLHTARGVYVLGVDTHSGAWMMRRQPGPLARLWADIQRAPRYSLPAARRRVRVTRVTAARQVLTGQPERSTVPVRVG